MTGTVRRGLRRGAVLLLAAAVLAGAAGCRKNLDKVPRDKHAALTADQLRQSAQDLIARKKYYRARQLLEKVLSRPNISREQIGDVNLAIADSYYYDGGIINVAEALSRYTSFLTFYPTHPRADYVQYQIGLCYLKQALPPDKDQSTTRKALDAFQKVARNHPRSDLLAAAAAKADECRERLAESEFRVGMFYRKRGAHPGAIDRFRMILENYPKYSRSDRVCFELARSLRALDRNDEALIYFHKVVEEYPRSRWASEAREAAREATAAPGRTAEATKGQRSAAGREGTPRTRATGG